MVFHDEWRWKGGYCNLDNYYIPIGLIIWYYYLPLDSVCRKRKLYIYMFQLVSNDIDIYSTIWVSCDATIIMNVIADLLLITVRMGLVAFCLTITFVYGGILIITAHLYNYQMQNISGRVFSVSFITTWFLIQLVDYVWYFRGLVTILCGRSDGIFISNLVWIIPYGIHAILAWAYE